MVASVKGVFNICQEYTVGSDGKINWGNRWRISDGKEVPGSSGFFGSVWESF